MAFLAIDQGTTATTVMLFHADGTALARASEPTEQFYPKAGWVEHDAENIYQSVVRAVEKVCAAAKGVKIDAVGITNQRETSVMWDRKTARPLGRAIVWQCRRTTARCEELSEHQLLIRQKTGLPLNAYFSATKFEWLLNQHLKARPQQVCLGTIDAYLLYRLSGGALHATDITNASRTMLYNIYQGCWDTQLCSLFGVDPAFLPQVYPSAHSFATITEIAALKGVAICSLAGDQQAALFGQGVYEAGGMKNTYGTGAFVLLHTGARAVTNPAGMITTPVCDAHGKAAWGIEGSIYIAGAAVQWLRDELGLIDSAEQTEQIAQSIDDTDGVYFVPGFVGLGAPYWDMHARGLLCGLSRGSGKAHIVRAVLESLAYQSKDVIEAMSGHAGVQAPVLRVDGGAAANDFLMQFQADILDIPVERPELVETTAVGAAQLSALGCGAFASAAELRWAGRMRRFEPALSPERRHQLYEGWKAAIARCRLRES